MYIPTWVIIGILLLGYLFYTRKRKKDKFIPFNVHVLPKWYDLLKDYNLVDDVSWQKLAEEVNLKKNTDYNIIQDGITFTVLESNVDTDLIYYNSRKSFHSEVAFQEVIEELKFPNELLPSFPYSPRLWIRQGIQGYEIGITTPESNKKIHIAGDENDFIKIATIPYCLFYIPRFRYGVAKKQQIEEQLQKQGWFKQELHERWKENVLFRDVPEVLEHKYFEIHYKYI